MAPDHPHDRGFKSAEVPNLNAFTESAPARHHIVVAIARINAISTDRCLASDRHIQPVGSDIPEADLTVPAARHKHVGCLGVESAREDLISVGRVYLATDLLDSLHADLVIDLDIGLGASDTKAALIPCIVNRMVPLLVVQLDVFNHIAVVVSPADNAAVEAGAKELLLSARRVDRWFPGEACDWREHLVVMQLVESLAQRGRENLQ